MPRRIQRRRVKGWRMPPNCVYVGRPTVYQNPFDWRKYGRELAVVMFADYADGCWLALRGLAGISDDAVKRLKKMRKALVAALPALRGKDLACWCPLDEPCHADVLLHLANEEQTS